MNNFQATVRHGGSFLALAGLASLMACGGGGDGGTTNSPSPQSEATSSRAMPANSLAGPDGASSPVQFYKGSDKLAIHDGGVVVGCVVTGLSTYALDSKRPGDAASTYRTVYAFGYVYNTCTGDYVEGFGQGDAAKLTVNAGGARATSAFTIAFPDGTSKSFSVDLRWDGGLVCGEACGNGTSKVIDMGPFAKSIVMSSASSKSFVSVTGVITIDGVASPVSDVNGRMYTSGTTSIQIIRTP